MIKSNAAEFVYIRTYSRWLDDIGRRENWEETVDRYINFITEERKDLIPTKVIKKIREKILNLEVMPSMRALWAAGLAAKDSNVCMYNCSALVVDSIESFAETLYVLCCGAGLGFSVQNEYINKLPTIKFKTPNSNGIWVIPDDKIGWADSIKVLMQSLYGGKDIEFDYTKIRPAGAKLKVMGGRASGSAPLISLHRFIREVFNEAQGRKLNSLECSDIMNKIAEIVIVGGVRRSSEISLSDLDDKLMRDAKNWPFPLHRSMSNNSAVYLKKPTAVEFMQEWTSLAASGTGERGIFNLETARKNAPSRRDGDKILLTNPCQPAFAKITLASGEEITMGEIKIGNVLLNKNRKETIVINKFSTGIKDVYSYGFVGGSFVGTENHKVVCKNISTQDEEKKEINFIFENNYTYVILTDLYGWQSLDSKNYLGKYEVFDITVSDDTHTYLTNGIYVSNCGEINLRDTSFCNLSEIVVRDTDDLDSLLEKVETATWIGVIQSTFTHFPYLRDSWKINCEEERLLGVSITGQMDNKELLTPTALRALKQKAIKVAKHASQKLNINMPTAITCTKPSGSVSELVSSSSGIHLRYSKFYIRRYRISSLDPLCKMMHSQGVKLYPEVGQENLPKENVSTWIVEFPIKSPEKSVCRTDMDAIAQLEWYKTIQANWCEHNSSCTVYVKDDEWLKVGNWVYENWDIINGVSFLPYDGGKYKMAPFEEITEDKYNKLVEKFQKIDYSQLSQFEEDDNTDGAKTFACTGDKCTI